MPGTQAEGWGPEEKSTHTPQAPTELQVPSALTSLHVKAKGKEVSEAACAPLPQYGSFWDPCWPARRSLSWGTPDCEEGRHRGHGLQCHL